MAIFGKTISLNGCIHLRVDTWSMSDLSELSIDTRDWIVRVMPTSGCQVNQEARPSQPILINSPRAHATLELFSGEDGVSSQPSFSALGRWTYCDRPGLYGCIHAGMVKFDISGRSHFPEICSIQSCTTDRTDPHESFAMGECGEKVK